MPLQAVPRRSEAITRHAAADRTIVPLQQFCGVAAMPKRLRSFRLFPIALSPASLAAALDVDRRKIDHGIKFEGLPIYQHGAARRILVCDAVDWIRRTWKKGK
jgi:hypothetical protein